MAGVGSDASLEGEDFLPSYPDLEALEGTTCRFERCPLCREAFDNTTLLSNHLQGFPCQSSNFWCNACRMTFASQRDLESHYRGNTHTTNAGALGLRQNQASNTNMGPRLAGGFTTCAACGFRVLNRDWVAHLISQEHLERAAVAAAAATLAWFSAQ